MRTAAGLGRTGAPLHETSVAGGACGNAAVVARIIGYYALVGAAGVSSLFLH